MFWKEKILDVSDSIIAWFFCLNIWVTEISVTANIWCNGKQFFVSIILFGKKNKFVLFYKTIITLSLWFLWEDILLNLLRCCKVLFMQSLRATVSSNSLEIFGNGCFDFSIYFIFPKKGTIHVYDHILSHITMYHPHFVSSNQILAIVSNSVYIFFSWTLW
jgi:hypothetical protein